MTSADLLGALGDDGTDPFLDDPFAAADSDQVLEGDGVFAGDFFGNAASAKAAPAKERNRGASDSPVGVLPLDSVFFDDEVLPSAPPATPKRAEPPPVAPEPAAALPQPQAAPPQVAAALQEPPKPLTLPGRPWPGTQYTAVTTKNDVEAMNAALRKGWRVRQAVTVGTDGEVLVVFEYGGNEADGPPPKAPKKG